MDEFAFFSSIFFVVLFFCVSLSTYLSVTGQNNFHVMHSHFKQIKENSINSVFGWQYHFHFLNLLMWMAIFHAVNGHFPFYRLFLWSEWAIARLSDGVFLCTISRLKSVICFYIFVRSVVFVAALKEMLSYRSTD